MKKTNTEVMFVYVWMGVETNVVHFPIYLIGVEILAALQTIG